MTASLGQKGEDKAARYYFLHGYKILQRNFRTRQGEIDLIASKGDILVFVEVKTRSAAAIDTPAAFVTAQKQQRILLAAKAYLAKQRNMDAFVRFDVVEVLQNSAGKLSLHCIENAFTE